MVGLLDPRGLGRSNYLFAWLFVLFWIGSLVTDVNTDSYQIPRNF